MDLVIISICGLIFGIAFVYLVDRTHRIPGSFWHSILLFMSLSCLYVVILHLLDWFVIFPDKKVMEISIFFVLGVCLGTTIKMLIVYYGKSHDNYLAPVDFIYATELDKKNYQEYLCELYEATHWCEEIYIDSRGAIWKCHKEDIKPVDTKDTIRKLTHVTDDFDLMVRKDNHSHYSCHLERIPHLK